MKTVKTIFSILGIILFINISLYSQDLKSNLSLIKEKITEVTIDKTTFKQSFETLDEEKGKVSFTTVEIDEKGKSVKSAYEFYLTDIDKNTILRKTSGKKLFVSFSMVNNQKFIKYFIDDQLNSYVNKIEIQFTDADIAQEMVDLFKKTLPLVKSSEVNWKTNTEALAWLKANIGEVSNKTVTSSQTFSFGERKDYLVNLLVKKSDSKGTAIEEKYEFSVLDLNKTGLAVKINGAQLSVNLEIKGGEKYIKYFKNNEQQSYDNNVEILASDIDQARKIMLAFEVAIAKSKPQLPEFSKLEKALEFLKNSGSEVSFDGKTYKQQLDFTMDEGTKSTFILVETESKGKSIENTSILYLSDLDPNSLNLKVSGKKILLICNTKNNVEFVKTLKDNIVQNYEKNIEVLFSDLETAREAMQAFKYSIKESEIKPMTWKSVSDAMAFLKTEIIGESIAKDQYKLSFSGELSEPYKTEYIKTKTDANGVNTEFQYIFYPYMLDANTTKIKSSGKYLSVITLMSNKSSFVKYYKSGKQQSYDNELEIMAFDPKQARNISEAIKYIVSNTAPKAKDWSDKKKNMEYVKQNVGNFTNDGIETIQKIELNGDEPCKISYTVSTSDDKGKTTEEIYEFSLSDMNKSSVTYKVNGKNVVVTFSCKSGEKFVKVYKNGQQQSFRSDVTIFDDDLEDAKNLADAFRNSIIQCE